ncbi:hypothetical protein NW762_001082 [Fusarium torreyae]|uniref:Uncharacterized protein n=1 Tax=Fusarium torreyae TaxID=1237075 RepID=A0A9W8SHK1_9HYPO|nr:hypothetical protein NW762_001082 [Fusarium torreyae]
MSRSRSFPAPRTHCARRPPHRMPQTRRAGLEDVFRLDNARPDRGQVNKVQREQDEPPHSRKAALNIVHGGKAAQ